MQINSSSKSSSHKASAFGTEVPGKAVKKSAKAEGSSGRLTTSSTEYEPRNVDRSALRRLKAERQRLLDEIQRQEIPFQDHPTSATHMADEASEVTEQITAVALRRNLEELLRDVDSALARVEQGTYGLCDNCGQAISEERLQVLPFTKLCITCARTRDHSTNVTI